MNTRERFVRTLTGKEVDRVPFMKVFGGDNATLPEWLLRFPNANKYIDELLGFEGCHRGWRPTPVNMNFSGLPDNIILKEDERNITYKRGNGAVIQVNKQGDFHEHVMEYPVKNANDWDRLKTQYLDPYDKKRIPADWDMYVQMYKNRDYPLQLTSGGVYGFARNLMGDEALCYAFYDTPELIHDIIDTYTDTCIKIWEIMCKDVEFDLVECWEDMASKTGSIISPNTFSEFLSPSYKKIKSFIDSQNIPILLVDSDGNIENLAHQMVESGVNAMYPFEVGAGNDVFKTLEELPTLGAIGCLEKNSCALGKEAVDEQMEIARKLIKKGRCIPGPDHFVLNNVTFEQYKYFMTSLKDVIMNTKPE